MFIEPDKMLENCPKEIEADLKDIVDLSEDFLDELDIVPNQNMDEIKIDLQEAKNYLFQIITRFVTLINESFIGKEKDSIDTAFKMKFEEDIGAIMGDLKKKPADRLESAIGITALLKFSGELKTAFDFLIYNPITRINKKEFTSLEKYYKDIFVIVRANASILGYEAKPVIPLSKVMLPRPEAIISKIGKKTDKEESEPSGLEGLGEEEEEEEED